MRAGRSTTVLPRAPVGAPGPLVVQAPASQPDPVASVTAASVTAPSVTAPSFTAMVLAHADRVHDLVRRRCAAPDAAPDAVEAGAVDALTRAAAGGSSLTVLLGHWCAAACARAASAPRGPRPDATDGHQELLAGALDRREAAARTALLLLDAYRLPAEAAAVALGLDLPATCDLVGRARLELLPEVYADDSTVPDAHLGTGALAALAAGDHDDRHVHGCDPCREALAAQQDVRALLAGLTVLPLPPDGREALLERVAVRARVLLPAREPGPVAPPARLLGPAPVALGLLLAVLLGVGLGALLSHRPAPAQARLRLLPPVAAPSATPLPGDGAGTPAPAPSTVVFTYPPAVPVRVAPRVVLPSSTAPSPPPTTSSPQPVRLDVDPARGPTGTQVHVTGTGWTPGETVSVVLLDPAGQRTGAAVTAVAGRLGRISALLTVAGSPGSYVVEAGDGLRTADAAFVLQ